jgi:hypothetical protein
MAQKFFYVCASVFMLAGAYAIGARGAGAQGPAAQEIAVLSGQIADGGTIPLPSYRDGSEALESECFWTVSAETQQNVNGNTKFARCSTAGRTVRVYWCYGACGPAGDCVPLPPGCTQGAFTGTANYLIIAVRNTAPTAVRGQSFGSLKARHR